MQKAYLDCEFTSLDPYYEPISLALVVPNGPEFYVDVLPLLDLDKYGRTQSRAADELQQWLSQFDGIEIISDAPQWDWPLLVRLAGPDGLAKKVISSSIACADQAQMTDLVFPHHALQDARLIADFVESIRNRLAKTSARTKI
ncbi:hypothetical protein ACTACH_15885 [Pseudomonas syringae]|uniref:hypothetical protein n=1 Tax=Pseudomonas syringae TaxID=317 RepID=UPI0006998239|nr:hypothetical protein [Pseudomonas syringae]